MNINKKYIIIFGISILLLIVVTGVITYYKEKGAQTQILDVQISDIKQSVPIFFQNYPTNSNEIYNFLVFCRNTVFSDTEELKSKNIKEVFCTLEREAVFKDEALLTDTYTPSFSSLESIISLKYGRYIGISVDLKDVIREYNPSLLKENKLYFCSISEPSWADPFGLEIRKPKQTLVFNEGEISCYMKTEESLAMYFYGFIPQAESLNIKHYLVNEQTVSDVMNKQSFSEIKDILSNYPIIWQMEKPITL